MAAGAGIVTVQAAFKCGDAGGALLDARPERRRSPRRRAGSPRTPRPAERRGSRTSRWSTARLDGAHGQLLDRIAIGDGLHAQVVGDQDAAKAQLAAQQLRRDPARQRGRAVGVQRRVKDVRGHEGLHAGLRRRRERRQLDPAQPFQVVRHDGQLVVRVGPRVAMPREVLAAADEAGAPQPAPERQRVRGRRRRARSRTPDRR